MGDKTKHLWNDGLSRYIRSEGLLTTQMDIIYDIHIDTKACKIMESETAIQMTSLSDTHFL